MSQVIILAINTYLRNKEILHVSGFSFPALSMQRAAWVQEARLPATSICFLSAWPCNRCDVSEFEIAKQLKFILIIM